MRSPPHFRWLIVIGSLPMLMLCGGENRASASCGDYLQIISKDSPAIESHMPGAPHAPCHGPNCQQRREPAAPVPVPVPPTSPNPPADAILASPVEFDVVVLSRHPDPEVRSGGREHLEAIFHPPR